MSSFWFFIVTMIVASVIIILSFIFSLWYNAKIDAQGSIVKYERKEVSKEMLAREKYIMNALRDGEIKCHILPNSALPYNVGEWVENMEIFMKKPIFKQLMDLEGYSIDEKYKN